VSGVSPDIDAVIVGGTDSLRAYPTGYNLLPKFYVWSGALPYTANGTTACATANSLDTTPGQDALGVGTSFVPGATPFPSVTNLPTASVYSLDEQDPKGWTYCYDYGGDETLGREFASLFTGDVFEEIYRSCRPPATEVAPILVVDAASFLLDETTSYVEHTKTESSVVSHSHTTESSSTSVSVLVNPVRLLLDSTATQLPSLAEEADEIRSTTAKSTQLDVSHTIGEVGSIQAEHNSPSAQSTRPTLGSEKSTADPKPLVFSENTIAASNSVRFVLLDSLIRDIGRIQPSSTREASEDFASMSTQSEISASRTTTMSPRPAANLVGTKTPTTGPSQPTEPDPTITAPDTRIDMVSGTAELVADSHTSTLSTTKGIGDYVWAGIADLLPAVSVSASSASDPPTGIPSTSLDLLDPLVSPVTSISEAADSDDGITVEGSAIESTIAPDSSSTRTKNADDDLEGSSTMSNTNAGTTSQVEPTAVSSSPSDQQGQSSENKVGPSVVTPSVGIWILSLLIFVLL
jgi:hypothetical protein